MNRLKKLNELLTLNNCPICTALIFGDQPFCDFCSEKFSELVDPSLGSVILTEHHRVYYLLRWNPSSHFFVSRLIYALKGEAPSGLVRWLAEAFLLKHQDRTQLSSTPILVPAPSRACPDHAHLWAKSLADLLQACVWSPTLRTDEPQKGLAQKLKSGVQRSRVTHRKRPVILNDYKGAPRKRPLVFCDDVYTTGATALATSCHFKDSMKSVFCIAYRERLKPMKW